ncbi:AAA family ATPase [uncultured Jatrophihabitans sp.]|uniref:AAA family ATPase n=1 Tax=uncultured Jatrophihabitans sp. TaxID=1610747 RepID=UPI0035CA1A43
MTGRGGPQLVVFGGLPGVGKTTLARRVADALGVTFLRIDTIEAAAARSGLEIGDAPVGYLVASWVAADQLRAGRSVVADAVNNVEVARAGWREVASETDVRIRFVHVTCDDDHEHRRRVESRAADLTGHVVPTWDDVRRRTWEPFIDDHLLVDNRGAVEPHVERIVAWLRR